MKGDGSEEPRNPAVATTSKITINLPMTFLHGVRGNSSNPRSKYERTVYHCEYYEETGSSQSHHPQFQYLTKFLKYWNLKILTGLFAPRCNGLVEIERPARGKPCRKFVRQRRVVDAKTDAAAFLCCD